MFYSPLERDFIVVELYNLLVGFFLIDKGMFPKKNETIEKEL